MMNGGGEKSRVCLVVTVKGVEFRKMRGRMRARLVAMFEFFYFYLFKKLDSACIMRINSASSLSTSAETNPAPLSVASAAAIGCCCCETSSSSTCCASSRRFFGISVSTGPPRRRRRTGRCCCCSRAIQARKPDALHLPQRCCSSSCCCCRRRRSQRGAKQP